MHESRQNRPRTPKPLASVLLALFVLSGGPAVAEKVDILRLELGDPARKSRAVELVLDAITDCRSGELLAPAELPPRLSGVRLLFVGESHTSLEFHRVQLRVIRELHEAGRQVLIGLEMYPYTEQAHLDRWIGGLLTEEGFVEMSRLVRELGLPLELLPRDLPASPATNGIPMFALNTPRELVRAVRKKGFENLTPEEADRVPAMIDTDSEEHFRAVQGLLRLRRATRSTLR